MCTRFFGVIDPSLKYFLFFFSAAVHGKFQDLVNAQPYQTQLDQQ